MICTATQSGSTVYVYDESGRVLFSRSGELAGFTGSSVSIRDGSSTYVYDEDGRVMFVR